MALSEAPQTASASASVPAGAQEWITAELIGDTIATWQPYYAEPLTEQEALEMLLHVGLLRDLLEQVDGQEKIPGASAGFEP